VIPRALSALLSPLLLALAALATGCASAPPAAPGEAPATAAATATAPAAAERPASASTMGRHPADPWEVVNRSVFDFNDALDRQLVKPVAIAYRDAVPPLVRTGIDNFFSNIDDLWSALNHVLQGKVHHGVEMGFRFLSNSFFGLGGILDPATEMGLVKRREDFGQTLGRWGVGAGPYVVLPVFGPRTLRDAFALLVDRQADPDKWLATGDGRWALFGLEVVNVRVNLLPASDLLDRVAFDPYTFMREAYLARRQDAVYDGAPPAEPFQDVPDDEPEKPKKK